MKSLLIPLLALALCSPAIAESKLLKFEPPLKASSGSRQGIDWVNYIYEIRIYTTKFKETRKANYVRHTRNQQNGNTDRTFGHWEANCGDPRWTESWFQRAPVTDTNTGLLSC